MIKYVCDMCRVDLPFECERNKVTFEGPIRIIHSSPVHLCCACATRAYNWLTSKPVDTKQEAGNG